jgi:hypothetical protein
MEEIRLESSVTTLEWRNLVVKTCRRAGTGCYSALESASISDAVLDVGAYTVGGDGGRP